MSQESFEKLWTELRPYIQKNKTRFRDPISVEKQVAATLYYLADEVRRRKVARTFGIEKSTVSEIIRRATQAVSKCLGGKYIVLRTNEKDIEEMESNFYNSHGFSQCIGAVDTRMKELKGHHLTQVTLSVGKENTHKIFWQQQITTTIFF